MSFTVPAIYKRLFFLKIENGYYFSILNNAQTNKQ